MTAGLTGWFINYTDLAARK